tara:strand:- start:518 stop:766 length:249 start_codon:yes stop_codon:yes gene_type:complete
LGTNRLLAEKGLCENPNFSMTPSGERGLRFSADYHFTDPVLFVPGDSGERIVIEDLTLLIILKTAENYHSVLSICISMYLMQ